MDANAVLSEAADSVFVTSTLTIAEGLQSGEGQGLAVSWWGPDGQELEQQYEFTFDGQHAYLWEWTSLDDGRQLDSARVPNRLTGEVDMTLWVSSRGDATFAVGYLDGDQVVGCEGVTGVFDSVSLVVWSTGTPQVVNFEEAVVRVQTAGNDLPDLFAGQSEQSVAQEGAEMATIVVLEPSEYLRSHEETDHAGFLAVPLLKEAAPPGMTVGTETLAGEEIVRGTLEGITFWVWTHQQYWRVVTAEDAAAGNAFVTACINEEHAAQTTSTVVVEQDYTAMPDGAVDTSDEGTTQVLGGTLVISPAERDGSMEESWSLPAAQSVTLTATWGAPSGSEDPSGMWMLPVFGRDPGAGVWLACWSDGTPVELVDMESRQVLATGPDGECGSGQSMTLTIDNSIDAPYSMIAFQGGGSPMTSCLGDQRYPLDAAGYSVHSEEPGFSVALESLTIEVD